MLQAKQHLLLLTSVCLQSNIDINLSQRAKHKLKKAGKCFMHVEKASLCKS